jgi:hypothetical protein
MSILNYLSEYSKDYQPPSIAWRDRRVWHRTKSNEMHYVKIKSLTPEEQMKYKPMDLLKKDKRAKKLSIGLQKPKEETPQMDYQDIAQDNTLVQEPTPPIEGEVFDFYYGVEDPKNYKDIEEDKLIIATLDSAKAVDMEDDDGLTIVYARNVPFEAVKEYMDEDGNWKKIEITDKDKKAEFIEFSENDFFKIDLYPYKDVVELELQNEDETNETEENESKIHNYENYLVEKELLFLLDNKVIKLIIENKIEKFDPKVINLAKKIAEKIKVKYDGMYDIGDAIHDPKMQKYINLAAYTDPITKSSFVVSIKDFASSLHAAWENLKDLRKKFDSVKPEPIEI